MRKAFSSLCSLYFNPSALFLLAVCMASDQWIHGSRPLKLLWHLTNKQRVIMARQGEHLKPYHINKNWKLYLSVKDECNWGAMVRIMWAANSYWVFRKYWWKKKPSGIPARFCLIDFAPVTASDFFIHILSVIMLLHAQVSSDNAATVSYCYMASCAEKDRKGEAYGGSEMEVSGGKMGMFLADRWSTLGVGPGSSRKTSNNVCLTEGRPLLTSFPSLFILTYLSFIHVSTYTLGQHPKKYLTWAKQEQKKKKRTKTNEKTKSLLMNTVTGIKAIRWFLINYCAYFRLQCPSPNQLPS